MFNEISLRKELINFEVQFTIILHYHLQPKDPEDTMMPPKDQITSKLNQPCKERFNTKKESSQQRTVTQTRKTTHTL
jgi:hypothetical protein